MITLYNARVVSPDTIFTGGVVVEGDKILEVFRGSREMPRGEALDCQGLYLSPGFVDIHVHGAYQASFFSADPAAIFRATSFHAEHGTTSILPTTASASHETVLGALKAIALAMKEKPQGARILGGHLEGNYLNPQNAGAQNPAFLYKADPREYMELIDTGIVRRVSASPEVEGALDMARRLSKDGILMSVAHSDADYDLMLRALDAGFTHVTHIYNAQSTLSSIYYYPQVGVCESALVHEGYTVEAICDGRHVPPQLLRLMYKIKGAKGMHAVTDSDLAGAPDGRYENYGMELLVEDGVCMLASRAAFAGSIATTDRLLRILYKDAMIPLADAVRMVTLTPAEQIGEERRIGRVAPGFDADINLFDDNISICGTMILGKFMKKPSIPIREM